MSVQWSLPTCPIGPPGCGVGHVTPPIQGAYKIKNGGELAVPEEFAVGSGIQFSQTNTPSDRGYDLARSKSD